MEYRDRTETLRENIALLRKREALTEKQIELMLDHIAADICADRASQTPKRILEEYYAELGSDLAPHAMNLCAALLAQKATRQKIEELLSQGNEETPAGAHGKIAYTKNKFNDLAFEKFSRYVRNAKVISLPSFGDACEALNDGACEYAILPLGNTVDGKLFGIYTMLDRYGFKICNVCDVDTDESRTVRYALVAKKAYPPSRSSSAKGEYILEFSIISGDGTFLAQLCKGFEKCGAALISVDSRPLPYDQQLKKYMFSLRLYTKDAELLQLWLTLCFESYSLIGFYPHVGD